MKKYIQIILVLGAFFFLVWFKNMRGSDENRVISSPTVQPTTPPQNPSPTGISASQSFTQPTTPPTPRGQYKDGTYTGSVADAYYGNIQVQAVISGGKISDVIFLQYPNDNGTSRSINEQAMPYLKSEALAAQNTNVDIVSGASDSSQAFRESLASALQQAR